MADVPKMKDLFEMEDDGPNPDLIAAWEDYDDARFKALSGMSPGAEPKEELEFLVEMVDQHDPELGKKIRMVHDAEFGDDEDLLDSPEVQRAMEEVVKGLEKLGLDVHRND